MRDVGMAPVRYDVIVIKGGLDQVTPTLSLDNGVAKDAVNYECSVTGGVTRIGGYERYDGQPSPSDATYSTMSFASFTNAPGLNDTITGGTSAATGVVVGVGSNYVAYSYTSGTFLAGEAVTVGATPIGTISSLSAEVSSMNNAIYLARSADLYRADIDAVPGSGSVLGVKVFDDTLYAFRANVGATAVEMYKESGAGWTKVNFEYEIDFSNANTSVNDGDTLTQGGVTATIRRVVVETGTLASGTNTGRLVISAPAGGNFAAGAATSTGGGALTLGGAQTAITLVTGGKFEFVVANLSGGSGTSRLYGCDGANRAFEFDGSYFVPIETKATTDKPEHIAVFKNYLMLSIDSSIMYSAPGDQYNFSVTAGAGEIATGEAITNVKVVTGSQSASSLAIYGLTKSSMLYGTSASNWQLTTYSDETGAFSYTAQTVSGSTYIFNQRGVTTMQASLNFGNFDAATVTNNIKNFIADKRTLINCSCVSRDKSQYRVFFSDGWGLYITAPNGRWIGSMPVSFPDVFNCATSDILSNGEEVVFAGDTAGYVYQMDKGTSFDGGAISASILLNYNTIGSPRLRKRYRKASLEIVGSTYASVSFGYLLGYASSEISQDATANYGSNLSSAYWDTFSWDGFNWDGFTLSPTECELKGTAENIAISLSSGTDYIAPYTINSIILHYSARRGMR